MQQQEKFAKVPINVVAFMLASRATVTELAVVISMYSYASNERPRSFPSLRTISRDLRLNRRRAGEAVSALGRDGLVPIGKRVIEKGEHAGLEVNEYDLPALEKLAAEAPTGMKRNKRRRPDRDLRRFRREADLPALVAPETVQRIRSAVAALWLPYPLTSVYRSLACRESLSDIDRVELRSVIENDLAPDVYVRQHNGVRFAVAHHHMALSDEGFAALPETHTPQDAA